MEYTWTLLFLLMPASVMMSHIRCQQGVNCHLPDCFCSTLEHPMNRSDIPQMVYFGFDDAVTGVAANYYNSLFRRERKNPNGCPLSMTLYVSHYYTQYNILKNFRTRGFELAAHSVTHTHINTGPKVYSEAKDQKENIVKFAGAAKEEIIGWRSPFLQTAGDAQVDMLEKLGYKYDISLTHKRAHMKDPSPWPFTLDYGWPYNCQIQPCPQQSHNGFWEFPVNAMRDYKDGYSCAYVDGCYNRPSTEQQSYKYIMDNFFSHYNGNRAPFGFNMHYAWFMSPINLRAMERAIQDMLQYHDVYIINVKQVLEWMKRPTKISELYRFEPWGCGLTTQKPPTTTSPTTTTTTSTSTTTTTTTTTTTPQPTTTTTQPTTTTTQPTTTTTQPTTTTPKPTTTTLKPTTTTPKPTTTTPKPTTTTTQPTTTTPTTTQQPTTKTTEKPTTTTVSTTTKTTTRKPITSTTRRRLVTAKPAAALQKNKIALPGPVPRDVCQQEVNCHLPDCYCATKNIPGGIPITETPQMVFITVDGVVNYQVYSNVNKLLSASRKNPNNCPVSATFFASQSGTFRMYLKLLNDRGMEVAMRGYNGMHYNDQNVLEEEMQKQLSDLDQIGIKPKGWRSPNLKPLGDGQFEKIMKYNFLYDSTLTVPRENIGYKYWPFTLDYGWKETCVIPDCPQAAYPGLWEVPNTPILDYRHLYICNYVDGCMFSPPTANDTFNFLWNNFLSHYRTNRAPVGVHLRHIWFSHPFFAKNLEGLRMFVDKLSSMNDVYILSIKDVIQWMKNPKSLQKIQTDSPWPC